VTGSFGVPEGDPAGPPAETGWAGTPAPEGSPADPGPAADRELAEFRAALAASTRRIVLTPTLLALNAAVFAVMVLAGAGLLNPDGQTLVDWGANFGPRTLSGQPWRLLTSAFVHISG
jgi:rhomboid protease GluP